MPVIHMAFRLRVNSSPLFEAIFLMLAIHMAFRLGSIVARCLKLILLAALFDAGHSNGFLLAGRLRPAV